MTNLGNCRNLPIKANLTITVFVNTSPIHLLLAAMALGLRCRLDARSSPASLRARVKRIDIATDVTDPLAFA